MRLESLSTVSPLLPPSPLRVRGASNDEPSLPPGRAVTSAQDHERLLLEPVASPQPPAEWVATTTFLATLARFPAAPPPWWKTNAQFRASLETHTDPSCYAIDADADGASAGALTLQLTLAGWGTVQVPGGEPQKIGPGQGFFAGGGAEVRHSLPAESPGWTFVRLEILHPYVKARLSNHIRHSGAMLDVGPGDGLTASLVRLARGAIAKDFRDQFEAELALFDFTLAFERCSRRAADGIREAQRLIDDVRAQVLARLPAAIEVTSLAEKFGMSRSYFSHFFRERTGTTPAHFATEVRIKRVEDMLRDTAEPLKSIAAACGFANANHLCKVFRRFRQHTPTAFRQSVRHWSAAD